MPKTQTITSGSYTFPIPRKERDRLLHSMSPCARAWFYDREIAALRTLEEQIEGEQMLGGRGCIDSHTNAKADG